MTWLRNLKANTGVIHTGLEAAETQALMAKLCVEGNRLMWGAF